MTTGTERPTVAVLLMVAVEVRNEEAARRMAVHMSDVLLASFPATIVSISSQPVPPLTQLEEAVDAASDDTTPIPVSAAAMESIGEPMERAPDDETAHLIAVLRDDADTLDRIARRHRDHLRGPMLMLHDSAGQLHAEADRLEGDSA